VRSALGRWVFRGTTLVLVPVALGMRSARRVLDVVVPVAVDAVLRRVDVAALAEDVINAIDLPGIVRREAGNVTSDFVHQTRARGASADDAVARMRSRLAGREPVPG
jgi:hypothetical protein